MTGSKHQAGGPLRKHRAVKALMEGRASLAARQFRSDPEPDYVGIAPDKLPY